MFPVRLNSIHYFIMKTPNKCEVPQIAFNHSSDTGFDGFIKTQKKCNNQSYSLLVTDTTFSLTLEKNYYKNLFYQKYKSDKERTEQKIKDGRL